MLKVNEKSDKFVLDLNNEECILHEFTVISVDENSNDLSWGVEFCTSQDISAKPDGRDTLIIEAPLNAVKKDEYVVLKNYNKERTRIVIKPNLEAIRPKIYKFKISSKKIDGRNVKIKILSKEGDNDIPWICTYQGLPLPYEITPMESDKGTHVTIKLIGEILGEFPCVIKFVQQDSGKDITLKLLQSNDSVKIIEAD